MKNNLVIADAYDTLHRIDVHAALKNRSMVKASTGSQDYSITDAPEFSHVSFAEWLPAASKPYKISPHERDYLLMVTPLIYSEIPNRNGVAFPTKELSAFVPDEGRRAFETWRGKPVHIEHDSEDCSKAIGVIIDTSMTPVTTMGQGNVWKIMALIAIDRTKDSNHARLMWERKRNCFSMGAMVNQYSCGYCGAGEGRCNHINLKRPLDFYTIGNRLVYRKVHGIRGFEHSSVADPAYSMIYTDKIVGRDG